jgi:hypothetical protein
MSPLRNKKFVDPTGYRTFKGQPIPATFRLDVKENQELTEGQVIGSTVFGSALFWSITSGIIQKG